MAVRELKQYEIVCDHCGKARVESRDPYLVPDGWSHQSVGPCGLTDYYREELWCRTCTKEARRE